MKSDKKQKKEKFFDHQGRIKLEPLNWWLDIIYTNDIRKAREKRKKTLGKLKGKLSKTIDGLCTSHKGRLAVFIMPQSSLGTISHEAYHAVCSVFEAIGVRDYDEELTAYHLGYIVDEIYNFIKSTNDEKEKDKNNS